MATKSTQIKPIEDATNKTWDEWVKFMEGINAKELDHHAIATKVLEELDDKIESPAWWAQGVTVAYEQFIGRRVPGQMSDGTFQTSVSKSTRLGMQELMDKWTDFATKDKDVLAEIGGEVKTGGTANRLRWNTKAKDGSTILVLSEPKKNGTASLVVQLTGLESLELNEQAKVKWSAILSHFIEDL